METYIFGGGDAARVVDADVPLVQRGDGPRRLALLFWQTGVVVVSDRAARELEDPRWRMQAVSTLLQERRQRQDLQDDLLQPIGVSANWSTVLWMTSSGSEWMSDERRNHCLPAAHQIDALLAQTVSGGKQGERCTPLPRRICAMLSCCLRKLFSLTSLSRQRSPSQLEIAWRYSIPRSRGPT